MKYVIFIPNNWKVNESDLYAAQIDLSMIRWYLQIYLKLKFNHWIKRYTDERALVRTQNVPETQTVH